MIAPSRTLIGRLLPAVLGVCLLLLAGVLVVSYRSTQRLAEADAQERRTALTLQELEHLVTEVLRAEDAAQDYRVSFRAVDRTRFIAAADTAREIVNRLAATAEVDAVDHLVAILPAVHATLDGYAAQIRGAPPPMIAADTGVASILSLINNFQLAERGNLLARQERALNSSEATTQAILVAGILLALVILLAATTIAADYDARRRAAEALAADAQRLEKVVATQQAVGTSALDLARLVQLIADRALGLTGATGAAVALREGRDVIVRAGSGLVATWVGRRLERNAGLLGRALQGDQTLRVNDLMADPRVDAATRDAFGARSAIIAPTREDGETTGLIAVVHDAAGHFTERDEQSVRLLAGLLAAALARTEALSTRESALTRLQESEERYRSVVAALHEGILLVHADGSVRAFNESAARHLGLRPATLKHLNLLERHWTTVREDEEPGELPFAETLRTGRPVSGQVLGLDRSDGSRVWLRVSTEPLWRSGDPLPYAAVASMNDITEAKLAVEALRQAKDAAEDASQAKSRFLASMSHELRTPLNSVIGFADILLRNRDGALNERDLLFLRRISDNGRHLLTLINDILDLSKIEAGRVEVQVAEVELGALVTSVTEQLADQVPKQVMLTCETPEHLQPLVTDEGKLRQVLINLVGNALRFTPEGRVTVRIAADGDGEPLLIEVIDTGVGIPVQRQQAIFRPFEQGDDSTGRRYGGTGLGLAISRTLLDQLGFDIEVESAPGAGSTFRILLQPPAVVDDLEPLMTGRPKRVLVIDDETDSRIILRRFAEDAGYETAVAANMADGLRLAREFGPDVLTLDVRLRNETGWEVIEAMRADPGLRSIPVVIVTGSNEVPRGGHGIADVLEKPVSRTALRAVLHRVAGPSRLRALLVDDDADARLLVEHALREQGVSVRVARDGHEALLDLEHELPDMLILDLRMPRMTGESLLRELRVDSRTSELPVIVVTSKEIETDERTRLEGLGALIVRKGESLAADLRRAVIDVLAPRPTARAR